LEDRKQQRKKRKVLFIIRMIFILLIAGAVVFLLKAPMFNVEKYNITGNSYYTNSEILVMGNCNIGSNIFIGVDTKDITNRLLKDAYMDKVEVKRELPNTINITLKERHQLAALVYGEKYIVVSQDATLLRKTSVDPELPVLKGFSLTKMELGSPIEVEEKVQLRQTLEIADAMERYDMYFKAIEFSNGEIQASILDNLVLKGTSEEIIAALKAGSIQAIVLDLFSRDIERGTIIITDDKYISYSPEI